MSSRIAKIAVACAVASSAAIVYWVHENQKKQQQDLKRNLAKDFERVQQRQLMNQMNNTRSESDR